MHLDASVVMWGNNQVWLTEKHMNHLVFSLLNAPSLNGPDSAFHSTVSEPLCCNPTSWTSHTPGYSEAYSVTECCHIKIL